MKNDGNVPPLFKINDKIARKLQKKKTRKNAFIFSANFFKSVNAKVFQKYSFRFRDVQCKKKKRNLFSKIIIWLDSTNTMKK